MVLAPSPVGAGGFAVWGLAAVPVAVPRPVRSSFLKASTSREPFPPDEGFSNWGRYVGFCPLSSSVFWNGFAGGLCDDSGGVPICPICPSPERLRGDGAPLNGSSPSSSSFSSSLLVLLSSSPLPPRGYASGAPDDDSGDDGGGDCTRTFLTTFGFWKLVEGGGWDEWGRAWSWLRK